MRNTDNLYKDYIENIKEGLKSDPEAAFEGLYNYVVRNRRPKVGMLPYLDTPPWFRNLFGYSLLLTEPLCGEILAAEDINPAHPLKQKILTSYDRRFFPLYFVLLAASGRSDKEVSGSVLGTYHFLKNDNAAKNFLAQRQVLDDEGFLEICRPVLTNLAQFFQIPVPDLVVDYDIDVDGRYRNDSNTIVINPKNSNRSSMLGVLVHEVYHAVQLQSILNYEATRQFSTFSCFEAGYLMGKFRLEDFFERNSPEHLLLYSARPDERENYTALYLMDFSLGRDLTREGVKTFYKDISNTANIRKNVSNLTGARKLSVLGL